MFTENEPFHEKSWVKHLYDIYCYRKHFSPIFDVMMHDVLTQRDSLIWFPSQELSENSFFNIKKINPKHSSREILNPTKDGCFQGNGPKKAFNLFNVL